jgi:hypothetical protein
MQTAVPLFAGAVDTEDKARAMLAAVAQKLPGACDTYAAVGNKGEESLPPERTADHSPCVQRDLMRPDGPGAKYGIGLWRAAAAALAFWKDGLASLKEGLPLMQEERARVRVKQALAVLETGTSQTTLRQSEPRVNQFLEKAGMHGELPLDATDAGVRTTGNDGGPTLSK